jgi:hypothetical protein
VNGLYQPASSTIQRCTLSGFCKAEFSNPQSGSSECQDRVVPVVPVLLSSRPQGIASRAKRHAGVDRCTVLGPRFD